MALQQEGFDRKKRGYRNINEIDINMNDPLFTKQWYLVSVSVPFLMFPILRLQIKDALLFPHDSMSAGIRLSEQLCPLWYVLIFCHHPCISFSNLFSSELLSSHDLLGSKQLLREDQILPDSEKVHQWMVETCKKHKNQVRSPGRVIGSLNGQSNGRT